MESEEFVTARKELQKTQEQMGQLLGVSVKAIHSYEQGWRRVPAHVERQVFFLLSRRPDNKRTLKPCWAVRECPKTLREACPAWEFDAGTLCWFINGTICAGVPHKNWEEKMRLCRQCPVLQSLRVKEE